MVLNNIPSKYLSFYNSPDKRTRTVVIGEDVDTWYFNQFRFGEIIEKDMISFPNVKRGLPQLWNFIETEEGLILNAVTEYDRAGEITRYVEPAYSVKMLFYKIENFRLIFKDNRGKPKTDKVDKITTFQTEE